MNDRDTGYLKHCSEIASRSRDPRHQVGCVIAHSSYIVSVGYNRFPRGIEYTADRLNDKPLKRSLMIHAEEHALLNAYCPCLGATLYCNYRPCLSCARLIIQAGIKRVVWEKSNPNYPSPEHMFQEAGVEMAWKEQS